MRDERLAWADGPQPIQTALCASDRVDAIASRMTRRWRRLHRRGHTRGYVRERFRPVVDYVKQASAWLDARIVLFTIARPAGDRQVQVISCMH